MATLTRLYLGLWRFPCTAGHPRSTCFPNLRELELCNVLVESRDLDFILDRSPVLETLTVKGNLFKLHLRLVSQSLRCVQLFGSFIEEIYVVDAPRLEQLIHSEPWTPDGNRTRIKIGHAPKLNWLGYLDPENHVLDVGNTIIKARTRVNPSTMVPSVTFLAMEGRFGVRNDAKMIPSFLRCFPNVETLYIRCGKTDQSAGKLNLKFWHKSGTIKCIRSRINILIFRDFHGGRSELSFLKIFFENALAAGFTSMEEVQSKVVVSFLVNSLSEEVLPHVFGCTHASDVWRALQELYTSQSKSRVSTLRGALTNTKKQDMTAQQFITKMKGYASELAAAGKPVDDDELKDYILNGLDGNFNALVAAINDVPSTSLNDMCSQLLSSLLSPTTTAFLPATSSPSPTSVLCPTSSIPTSSPASAAASRAPGTGSAPTSRAPSKGGRKDQRGRVASPWQEGVFCQICKKEGHSADECWWSYGDDNDDDDTQKDTKGAYGVDTNWYIDTGATHHVTGQLNKLSVHDTYQGRDQVHNASGQDNNAFVEIHPFFFLIKDQATKQIVFRGPCHGGLYPLVPVSSGSSKHALVTIKPSSSTWHRRLGHPSSFIVQQVLRKNNLSYSPEINSYICDPCQQAKSHQLPYPVSTSVSKVPLEQIFSDVWGPAPLSVGKHAYYVSFIDDFSKFTWIYLLKKRSDVYQVFLDFQQYVERQFNSKIITMQTDWGGEYEKLNGFFQRVGIAHHVSYPHAHQQNGSAERKHRHIVEVGLALLANASMPLKFWDDAFITATFLINLLPTKVIADTSSSQNSRSNSAETSENSTSNHAAPETADSADPEAEISEKSA
ncbi:hypothetical protein ACQ4PT_035216 [Festuca glaucescens]